MSGWGPLFPMRGMSLAVGDKGRAGNQPILWVDASYADGIPRVQETVEDRDLNMAFMQERQRGNRGSGGRPEGAIQRTYLISIHAFNSEAIDVLSR